MRSDIKENAETIGVILVLLSGLFWGITGTLNKIMLNTGANPLMLIFVRNGFALLILIGLTLNKGREHFKVARNDIPALLICSLAMFCYSCFYFLSVRYLNVSVAVMILYLYPAMVAVASVFLYKEPITLRLALAIVLTLIGMGLSAGFFGGDIEGVTTIGLILGFLSAISSAAYCILVKKVSRKYHTLTVNVYGFALTVIGYGCLMFFFEGNALTLKIFCLAACTSIPYMLGFYTYSLGVKYLRPSFASIFGTSEAVFGTIFAIIILGEVVTFGQATGLCLIVAGIVVLELRSNKKLRGASIFKRN